jgi:predicted CXXCH cytochrome family protein
MQRLPPELMRAAILASTVLASLALAGQADDVYRFTAHGSTDAGVLRSNAAPRGHCLQCHVRQLSPGGAAKALFTTNDNALCYTCHDTANASGTYGGPALFLTSAHWSSGRMLWPGPTPAARSAGEQGKCLNCHAPHGAKDGLGLIQDLANVREQSLCLTCHDATGPSVKNVLIEVQKRSAHNPVLYTGKHVAGESSPAAFAAGTQRHVECTDCHNPHRAVGPDGGAAQILAGASRVRFSPASGARFTYLTNGDTSSVVKEYEVCFKCHSSWTTLPAGAADKAAEFDPATPSFHPVVAAGTNPNTAIINANMAGGTGLPHLTATSIVECQDCHASDSLPLTVSSVSSYVGTIARGPHGSNVNADAGYSGHLLRARYKVTGTPGTLTTDAELCFICHSSAFSNTTSHFNQLGHHQSLNPRPLCGECHANLHGSAANPALITFAADVTGARTFVRNTGANNSGSCTLSCHGMNHNALRY